MISSRSILITLLAGTGLLFANWVSPYGFKINKTPSIPVGAYWMTPVKSTLKHREVVSFRYIAPEWAQNRSYFPPGAPLLKRIIGLEGDVLVCKGDEIFLRKNGQDWLLGGVRKTDSHGKPVTALACPGLTVGADEVFLMGDRIDSMDSRYLGAVKRTQLIESAYPLVTF